MLTSSRKASCRPFDGKVARERTIFVNNELANIDGM